MATDMQNVADKWAQRGVYFLVMGVGAFFVYFNESYGWVKTPEYPRLSDLWLGPIEPYLQPHLPTIVIAIGVIFLVSSCYSFYRFAKADAAGSSAG
jgi:hypothetical protein